MESQTENPQFVEARRASQVKNQIRNLENKVDSLETKIDSILKLLKAKGK